MTKGKISKVILIFFALIIWAISQDKSTVVFAQDSQQIESCFKYYDYGKVKVYLSSDKPEFSPGETVEISGTINNLNSFPLRDVILYGQLKRINEGDDFNRNGHYLVDRKTFLTDLNLLPGEVKNITFTLPVNQNYPAGDYQLAYFIFSKNGFNYAGRNFLEEDYAGVSNFTIIGKSAQIYFDPDSLTVNRSSSHIRDSLTKLEKSTVEISINLKNDTSQNLSIPASYYIYSYDDGQETNLIEKGEQVLNLQNNYTLKVDYTPQKGGAYVFLAAVDQPVASRIKYRFAVEGNDPSPLRMNDLGITNYPAGEFDRAYLCFHSATDRDTPIYTVRLSILDTDNNLVDVKEVTASFDSSVAAISLPLAKLIDRTAFKIRADIAFAQLPDKTRKVEISYSCNNFSNSVGEVNLSYASENPETLQVAGRDGCGETTRLGGVIDELAVYKDGKKVIEDYNTEVTDGIYHIGELPQGNYIVEAKKGDTVKVLNIAVPQKNGNQAIKILLLIFLISVGLSAFFWIRRKFKTKNK